MNDDILTNLPPALLASVDYKALNARQRSDFAARLRYCIEIAVKGGSAAKVQGAELLDAIDDIELDALSIMSGFGEADTTVSIYQIHSSWTFECDRQAMAGYVSPDVASFLASAHMEINATDGDVRSWLRKWSEVLNQTFRRFFSASSFTEAVVHLIIVDALVSSYLMFAAIARLRT